MALTGREISVWQSLQLRWWPRLATALTIIGLVDVTHQLIEWTAVIPEVALVYAEIRSFAFSLLPVQIPPEWHNSIVLGGILFGVTNIGFYRQTGKIFIIQAVRALVVWLGDSLRIGWEYMDTGVGFVDSLLRI